MYAYLLTTCFNIGESHAINRSMTLLVFMNFQCTLCRFKVKIAHSFIL